LSDSEKHQNWESASRRMTIFGASLTQLLAFS